MTELGMFDLGIFGSKLWTPAELPALDTALWLTAANQFTDEDGETLATSIGGDRVSYVPGSFGTSRYLIEAAPSTDQPVYQGADGVSFGVTGAYKFAFSTPLVMDLSDNTKQGTLILCLTVENGKLSTPLTTVADPGAILYTTPPNMDLFDDSLAGGSVKTGISDGKIVVWINRNLGAAGFSTRVTGDLADALTSGIYTFANVGGIDADLGSGSETPTRFKGLFYSNVSIPYDETDGLAMRAWLAKNGYIL